MVKQSTVYTREALAMAPHRCLICGEQIPVGSIYTMVARATANDSITDEPGAVCRDSSGRTCAQAFLDSFKD